VFSVAYSPDGNLIMTGSADMGAELWGPNVDLKLKGRYVAFSPDGSHALTAWGKIAYLYDVATGKELKKFKGHTESISAVAYSPKGNQVLTGSFDGTVRLWDVKTGAMVRSFPEIKKTQSQRKKDRAQNKSGF
jgi:WD40 repeat protein